METIIREDKNTLYVTAHCFAVLFNEVILKFKETHKAHRAVIGKISQLYGFGNYNESLPNLRHDLEALSGDFINGKYLYDKGRELQLGKPIIKLNGYYKTILFQYVGYTGIKEFTKLAITDAAEKEKQLELLSHSKEDTSYYYVGYHFGEYREIVKCQIVVSNNWKDIQYTYIYHQKDGTIKTFLYQGIAKKRADIIHVQTKTLLDGKMVNGGENILYAGHSDPGTNAFMVGVFSAFDINNRVISGKLICEKYNSKEEMITNSLARKIPAYIAQEIRNVRIENDSTIPSDALEISFKSPYSITYAKIPGQYCFSLIHHDDRIGDFTFLIDADTFKMTSLTEGILINKNNFELIQNGTVIHFSFQLTGIAPFTRLEAFVKTYYLNTEKKDVRGVFSGLDIENRLINGEVDIRFESAK